MIFRYTKHTHSSMELTETEDANVRKRRRRSIRTLRRQSGIQPLNLNILDDGEGCTENHNGT